MRDIPAKKLIDKTLRDFVKRLHEVEGDNLLQVTLFGSAARGEAGDDSDLDVFVLLGKETGPDREVDRVSHVAFRLNLAECKNGVYISPFTCTREWYEQNKKRDLIFYNIAREGVVLYDVEK